MQNAITQTEKNAFTTEPVYKDNELYVSLEDFNAAMGKDNCFIDSLRRQRYKIQADFGELDNQAVPRVSWQENGILHQKIQDTEI